MRFINVSAALVGVLSAPAIVAGKSHGHRHGQHSAFESRPLQKRGGQCQFPTDDSNMVAVTPDAKNAGWAMSPDQECKPGSYCPYACKPGMVMNQWDPKSTYDYPSSMVCLRNINDQLGILN